MGPVDEGWAHRTVTVNAVRLHLVEAGAGPVVLLLHGFPEFWYSWRHQLSALAQAGFRAVALDLRGYNLSDKPAGVRAYRPSVLVADLVEFIRQEAGGKAHVVGHDWGGLLAWRLAQCHPELIGKLVILNSPHAAAYRRELKRGLLQRLRSWYILFFQLPLLPEWVLRVGNYAVLVRNWRREPVNPSAFTPRDIAEYRRALDQPGALTATINYYRALFRHAEELAGEPQTVSVPTLLIWGERDRYLDVRLTEGLEPWVPDLRVERIAAASHWVQNDAPEQVNRLLLDFFRGA